MSSAAPPAMANSAKAPDAGRSCPAATARSRRHDPVKSVGSYWPYASTLIDYIRRAMPFGAAQTLTNDELYAITAYVLFLNDIIKTEDFELSDKNFRTIKLPNEDNFFDDDREVSEKAFWRKNPCMTNCAPGDAKITGRAQVIDVTPESGKGSEGGVMRRDALAQRNFARCRARGASHTACDNAACIRRPRARTISVLGMRHLPSIVRQI